ncbi:uncharacterized protein F4822DRAFT_396875 [Hypoxylon trugodes]|uniref:uncharacterized protein n=1 Tax=Hypoxylon trugodes TaxID=326681 RepID=UPI0021A215CE|nr:uncharacterized protein F4822DRAFT_396875 [Hypoxylon trugodes]KAI1391489.1 hypothetical protein F4822DRAFT_396875 [Hypoxylon trugodes]
MAYTRFVRSEQNAVLAFSALIAGAFAWTMWGESIFPAQGDPKGDPENWTREELRRWLHARNLHPQSKDTREQLLERVKANMR